MADHSRYSVDARASGRIVLVHSHAERIVVMLGDETLADDPRHFRRDQIIYDPWHYPTQVHSARTPKKAVSLIRRDTPCHHRDRVSVQ
jgi:hypothetical protein